MTHWVQGVNGIIKNVSKNVKIDMALFCLFNVSVYIFLKVTALDILFFLKFLIYDYLIAC